jgi:hypothetical protein
VASVGVVEQFGRQAVEEPPLPQRVTVDDLGVVCWMAVLPAVMRPETRADDDRSPPGYAADAS